MWTSQKLTFNAVATFFHSGVNLWQWPHLSGDENTKKATVKSLIPNSRNIHQQSTE